MKTTSTAAKLFMLLVYALPAGSVCGNSRCSRREDFNTCCGREYGQGQSKYGSETNHYGYTSNHMRLVVKRNCGQSRQHCRQDRGYYSRESLEATVLYHATSVDWCLVYALVDTAADYFERVDLIEP